MEKAKVYFTKEITPQAVIRMYEVLGKELPGKVAVKVHSGEKGNQNYLRPQFMQPMVEAVKGTIVECNTAYDGARNSTEKHKMLMMEHGWSRYFQVDLMDGEGRTWYCPSPAARCCVRTLWAKIWQTMIPCWCCLILRDIPWVALAEP